MELSPRVALPGDVFPAEPVPTKSRARRLCLASAALAHGTFALALGFTPARPPAPELVRPFAVVELVALPGGERSADAEGRAGPPQAQPARTASVEGPPPRPAATPPTPPVPAKAEPAPQAREISPRQTQTRPLREKPSAPRPVPQALPRPEQPAVKPVEAAEAREASRPASPLGLDRPLDAEPTTETQGGAVDGGDQGAGRAAAALNQGGGGGQGRDAGAASGAGGSVYSLGQVDRKPAVIGTVEPAYPRDARLRNLSGKVVLRFVVDATGGVRDARVVSAQPAGVFEDSALEAVRKWTFRPGLLDGKTVPTEVVLPVVFQLRS